MQPARDTQKVRFTPFSAWSRKHTARSPSQRFSDRGLFPWIYGATVKCLRGDRIDRGYHSWPYTIFIPSLPYKSFTASGSHRAGLPLS